MKKKIKRNMGTEESRKFWVINLKENVMTKKKFTSINVIMDKSGSMRNLASDTISSFNKFLAEQKEIPDEAIFTIPSLEGPVPLGPG
jgi:hypothetical protein